MPDASRAETAPPPAREPAAAGISVQAVESAGDFAALAPERNRLHDAAEVASVFNSWSWQYQWWRAYGRGRKLVILVASQAGAIIGILPLHLHTSFTLGAKVGILGFVGSGGDTHPDDLGPVLARGRESAAAFALAQAALQRPEFDVLLLNDMDSKSAFPAAMERAARVAEMPCTKQPAQRIAFVDLPRDWPAFIGSLSAQRRQHLRRMRRKLAAAHPSRFFVWKDAAQLDCAADRLAELHRERWQRAGGSESFATAQYMGFHRAIINAFFHRGWLRLYCLKVDGDVAAMTYSYRFRNRVYLVQAGFDPRYSKEGIGSVLLGYALEHAIAEGNEVFDFLRGEHSYKDQLASGCRETVSVTVLRKGFAALAYRLQAVLLPAWKASVRALLARMGGNRGGHRAGNRTAG